MIVITGATGTIGRELLRLLASRGADVRAVSRKSVGGEQFPGVRWISGDLADRESLADIFAGAEQLFLLTGNVGDMVNLQKNAIAAAEKAGISRVVKLSALGASDHSKSVIGVWHYNIEQNLRATGLDWTILRPHVFMQNLLAQRNSIQREEKVYSPSADARIPMIDTRDIAAVAAVTLTEPGHDGKRYTLTGPAAISFKEATAVLSSVLGKFLTYISETDDEAWNRLRRAGLPPWHIGAQLALADYQRQGRGTDIITNHVEEISGRPARTFEDFADDFASVFSGDNK